MKRTCLRATALCCAALLCAWHARALPAAEWAVTVVEVEGGQRELKVLELAPDGLRTAEGDVPFARVAELRTGTVAVPAAAQRVLLRNGDELRGRIVRGDDRTVVVASEVLGEQSLPLKVLEGIAFPIAESPGEEALRDFFGGAGPEEDRLLQGKGGVLKGTYEKLSDLEVTFQAGGQARKFTFDKVAALRIAPLESFQQDRALRGRVTLKDGSRITGALQNLKAGKLSIAALTGEAWTVPVEEIVSIAFAGGHLAYLTDREPTLVEERGYIGGLPRAARWRKNRAADGGALRIGEASYERGLGVASYSRLSYSLDDPFVRFLAEVGLAAHAPARGCAAWRVVVDGQVAAQGTAKAGEVAQAVKVDLQNAKTLELICDFGPDDDIGDLLIWGNPRLVRP